MTRILLEDAHWDGSGAPGERAWSKMLNDRIVSLLTARGIETVRVSGTTLDQPVYHEDYLAFITNHYDADIYVDGATLRHQGGAFWDRAEASVTAAQDDMLGDLIWNRYRASGAAPADHFERKNANTRDYYAFRYTSPRTPGVIFEWGVGAPVCNGHGFPSAPDHDWLRAKIDAIALSVAEGVLAYYLAQGGQPPKEDPMTPEQSAKLDRVLAIAEALLLEANANEPLVWSSRAQRSLDVERGKPFDAALPPIDPRIRT